MNFTDKLDLLLKQKNINKHQLSIKCNIPYTTIDGWYRKGIENIKFSYIRVLSDFFGVSIGYWINDDIEKLATNEFTPSSPSPGFKRISVLGSVSAGIPFEAIEDIIDYEDIPEAMARTGEFFGLRIKGASMEPRILEGDVVIVRRQSDVDSGDIAIVLVNGDEATCKKVLKNADGITLVAFNPTVYTPHFYTNKDITTLPVTILGKVMELRGKL